MVVVAVVCGMSVGTGGWEEWESPVLFPPEGWAVPFCVLPSPVVVSESCVEFELFFSVVELDALSDLYVLVSLLLFFFVVLFVFELDEE